MSIHWAESQLRLTGSERDAAYADMLAGVLTARGTDIPLPETVADPTDVTKTMDAHIGELAVPRVLVLREPAIDTVSKDASQLTIEQANLGSLRQGLQTIADPYARLFAAKTPPLATNIRSGRLGLGTKEGLIRSNDWTYTEVSNDMRLMYKFGITYAQGKDSNQLQKVRMAMKSQHDQKTGWSNEPEPKVLFDFENGSLTHVSISWHQATPLTLLKKVRGTLFEELLKDSFIFNNNDQDSCALNLTMGAAGSTPTLQLSQSFGMYVGAPIRDVITRSDFAYQPALNKFTRQANDPSLYQRLGLADLQELSSQEFMQIAADILHLIPAVEEHTIYKP